ncbi:MAG: Head-tail adaptor protein [Pseudomonadota bacterium]|nr:Head-tail adaptor protein [Pseudomonadota bacterium]
MLSASELAAMRATQAEALPGTAVISRNSPTSDGMGGWTDAWVAVGTVDARLAAAQESGAERLIADRIVGLDAWIITTPQGTDVTERDRVVIDSRTFEVVTVLPWSWETARRVVATEVT